MNGVRLLTPAEYRDAYAYMGQQQTRKHTVEVEDLLEPHLIRVQAEQVRIEASRRYFDTPTVINQRRVELLAAMYPNNRSNA